MRAAERSWPGWTTLTVARAGVASVGPDGEDGVAPATLRERRRVERLLRRAGGSGRVEVGDELAVARHDPRRQDDPVHRRVVRAAGALPPRDDHAAQRARRGVAPRDARRRRACPAGFASARTALTEGGVGIDTHGAGRGRRGTRPPYRRHRALHVDALERVAAVLPRVQHVLAAAARHGAHHGAVARVVPEPQDVPELVHRDLDQLEAAAARLQPDRVVPARRQRAERRVADGADAAAAPHRAHAERRLAGGALDEAHAGAAPVPLRGRHLHGPAQARRHDVVRDDAAGPGRIRAGGRGSHGRDHRGHGKAEPEAHPHPSRAAAHRHPPSRARRQWITGRAAVQGRPPDGVPPTPGWRSGSGCRRCRRTSP